MLRHDSAKWLLLLGLLIVANIGYYLYDNWGLVTVHVRETPLSKVIGSIEWQGWVRIYTNLPLDTKVTMDADHVPLAEAMETLAANIDLPPPPDGDDNARPRRDRFAGNDNQPSDNTPPSPATNAPPGQTTASSSGAPGGQGPDAAGGPPRGGRGFGRSAQWNLAFFVAPTSAQAQQEIRAFQNSDPNDENKVYTYGSQLQMISTENISAPDPRLQGWPGVKPVDPSSTPAPAQPATNLASNQPAGDQPDPNAPPTVHTYLQALAESANIWIMAPGSWVPPASAPPPNSSIISALRNLVGSSRGVVVQALVLRAGRGGTRGGGNLTGYDDAWADRMQNAINGLPAEERPEALEQLNKEVDFRKQVAVLPPEERRQKMAAHFMERMLYGERLSRLSPEKRAKAYQRMVTAKSAAQGR